MIISLTSASGWKQEIIQANSVEEVLNGLKDGTIDCKKHTNNSTSSYKNKFPNSFVVKYNNDKRYNYDVEIIIYDYYLE